MNPSPSIQRQRWRCLPMRFCLGLLFVLWGFNSLVAREVVLNHPDWPFFHANALDQPRLYGLLTDQEGNVLEDAEGPVTFTAFIDTGSSGFVLSNLHVTGEYDEARPFGFDEGDFIGEYTNLGLGGEEVGWVSDEFGVRLLNEPVDLEGGTVDDFIDYGAHRLWVRQQPGIGEVTEIDLGDGYIYTLVSAINIVGMPVIEQAVMTMDWIPAEGAGTILPPDVREMETKLLPHGDSAIPATNLTIDLAMRNFVEAGDDEILPSVSKNPVVPGVRITHDPEKESVVSDWLFDTGAGGTFISFGFAKTIGLVPEEYNDLSTFVADHQAEGGIVSQVGGIGPEVVTVPVVELNEIRVPARGGIDLVWERVRLMIFDHPELAELGLEGVFGMNLIAPSISVDADALDGLSFDELLQVLLDISPSPVETIVFEVTGSETAELRLFSDRVSSFDSWLQTQFTSAELEDESLSGPEADPGNFGIPMILRYAFGLDALNPDRSRLPRARFVSTEDTDEVFVMEHFRRRNDLAVDLLVEGSTNLEEWEPVQAEWTVLEAIGDTERVRAEVAVPSSEPGGWFFRSRVSLLD